MADSYQGPVKILDEDGVLLAVSMADLRDEASIHTWTGQLELPAGTGVAGKALVVQIEVDGRRGLAQLKPLDNDAPVAHSSLVGLGPKPF